ncbi:hypothetical protein [Kangiella taiwanensis]|uniref:SMODS and SLOG-associating 2TM effector domain-containing protein n=1 Tax=Kangiella taiwanensis TaxID=1079179 RepID=A0ABP8I8Z8_9GAMM|nr:hypothetical protein [Kangiella taiwanensis]
MFEDIQNWRPSVERTTQPFEAERKLPISSKNIEAVSAAIKTLRSSGLTSNKLLSIFEGWQSKRTVSTRRFLLSACILILGSAWVGVELSESSFLGIRLQSGNELKFNILLLAIVIITIVLYFFSWKVDYSIRNTQIERALEVIKPCIATRDELNRVAAETEGCNSAQELLDDFRRGVNPDYSDSDALEAINLYSENLSSPHKTLNFIEWCEVWVIFSLGFPTIGILVYEVYQKLNEHGYIPYF